MRAFYIILATIGAGLFIFGMGLFHEFENANGMICNIPMMVVGLVMWGIGVFRGSELTGEMEVAKAQAAYESKQCPQCGSRHKHKGKEETGRSVEEKSVSGTAGGIDWDAYLYLEYIHYKEYLICEKCGHHYGFFSSKVSSGRSWNKYHEVPDELR